MVGSNHLRKRTRGRLKMRREQETPVGYIKTDGISMTRDRSLDEFLETAYQQTHGLTQQWKYWCIILSLGVANSSDASEILCLSYILSDADFETHMLHGRSGGFLAAAVFLGMLLGGLFVGSLGDYAGRRPVLLLGLGCNAVAGLLSALAPTVGILSLIRCIAGVGIGATVPPLFTLVTELAPPSQRGLCVTLCASFWMVGSIYVALVALWLLEYVGASWRIFAIACAVPSALGGLLVWTLVPESPRFLALEQRHSEALQIVNSLAQEMDYRGPLLTLPELEKCFPRPSSQRPSNHHGIVHYGMFGVIRMAVADLILSSKQLYTPQLRQTTWPLQMVWFSLSFGSYGLLTWINTLFVQVHLKNVYFNALLFAFSNLPGNLITAIWMDRIGRSAMLIASVLAAATSLLSFAWYASVLHSTGIIVSACSFQCFTIAAWNTIDCMTSELFPTTVRSTGLGVCAASGRIGAMVAQFVNGALIAKPVRLLLVASMTLILGAMTPCLLPNADMTGKPVQDDLGTSENSDVLYAPLQQQQSNGQTMATVGNNGTSGKQATPNSPYQHVDRVSRVEV
jgi:VNT family MFS transporter (synaptic vesicle glycoprotein 2)